MNLNDLKKEFLKAYNPEKAKQAKAYMRNQFDFFGIDSKTSRQIQKDFLAKSGLPDYSELDSIIRECWEMPERTFQYFGQELVARYKKEYKKDLIELLEFMITINLGGIQLI